MHGLRRTEGALLLVDADLKLANYGFDVRLKRERERLYVRGRNRKTGMKMFGFSRARLRTESCTRYMNWGKVGQAF